jgi:hypothetical protein
MFAALGALVVVALLSLIITRVASAALIATGLPPDIARFQARSAFTGVGFTTDESGMIVRHPQRRRIAFHLMILGNLGTATILASLILGLLGPGPLEANVRFLVILGGLLVLLSVLRLGPVDRAFTSLGHVAGPRWLRRDLEGAPSELAEVHGDRVVFEVTIAAAPGAPDERRPLDVPPGSALVLGVVETDGGFRDVWAPNGAATYAPGERVVLFARRGTLAHLGASAGEEDVPEPGGA